MRADAHINLVVEVLDQRFPDWKLASTRQGGKTPNVASFRGTEKAFDSARDGYIWLVEQFMVCRPALFADPSSDTLTLALGKSRNYFGRKPEALFRGSPHLADDASNFSRLSNGWVANVNLNNAQKFDILLRFAALTGVAYPEEWEWRVLGATDLLADKQAAALAAKRLFEELGPLRA